MTSNMACVTGNPASSAEIIMSGTLASVVTFTSCFDTITAINAKPIRLKGGIPLGGTYSGPGVNSGTGIFTQAVAGTGTKTITYTYTNAAMCSSSKNIHVIVQASPVFNCGNNLIDIRDNTSYTTIKIGSQCWLAKNLNYGTVIASSQDQRDDCVPEKYCYQDNPINSINGTNSCSLTLLLPTRDYVHPHGIFLLKMTGTLYLPTTSAMDLQEVRLNTPDFQASMPSYMEQGISTVAGTLTALQHSSGRQPLMVDIKPGLTG
jgi:hypothetical protein